MMSSNGSWPPCVPAVQEVLGPLAARLAATDVSIQVCKATCLGGTSGPVASAAQVRQLFVMLRVSERGLSGLRAHDLPDIIHGIGFVVCVGGSVSYDLCLWVSLICSNY